MLVTLLLSPLGENCVVHGVRYTTQNMAKKGSVCVTVISLGIRLLKNTVSTALSALILTSVYSISFFTSLCLAFLLACIFMVGVYFGKASLKRPFLKLMNLLCFWFNTVIRFFCWPTFFNASCNYELILQKNKQPVINTGRDFIAVSKIKKNVVTS